MTSISCVLRSGGDYRFEHVVRLVEQINRQARCTRALLEPSPPSWWAKSEAWRMPGPNLQLDLDVSIVGNLTPLLEAAREHELIVCKDFWDGPHGLNSSVMAWCGDVSWLADEFAADADRYMAEYATKQKWGDQAFIRDKLAERGIQPVYWQDLLPGMVLSYKRDVLRGADTSNARIIVFHGDPKPWDDGVDPRWAG